MSIEYVTGDATRPIGDGAKIIAHICNDQGKWGSGFVVALSKIDRGPEHLYREWHRSGSYLSTAGREVPFRLGAVQHAGFAQPGELFGVPVWVANMIAQRGVRHDTTAPPAVDYPALREALVMVAVAADACGASVHMPRIGCGLGGGSWDRVESIIQETLIEQGVPVTVYDLKKD